MDEKGKKGGRGEEAVAEQMLYLFRSIDPIKIRHLYVFCYLFIHSASVLETAVHFIFLPS